MSAATLTDARAIWADAAGLDDADLQAVLDAAWERCSSYMPDEVLAVDPFVATPGQIRANVLDARDLYQAARREGDVIGFDTYAIRVRPLSATVRSLLRPPSGMFRVG